MKLVAIAQKLNPPTMRLAAPSPDAMSAASGSPASLAWHPSATASQLRNIRRGATEPKITARRILRTSPAR